MSAALYPNEKGLLRLRKQPKVSHDGLEAIVSLRRQLLRCKMMPCDPIHPSVTVYLWRLWYRVSDLYRNVARRIRKALHRCNAPVVTITHAIDGGVASEYDTYCSRCFRHLEEFSYGATRDGEFVVTNEAEVRRKSLELQAARDVLRVDTFECEDFTDLRDQITMLRKQAGMPPERKHR